VSTPPPPPAKGGAAGLAAKAGGKRNLLIAAAVGTAAVAFVMSRGGKGSSDGAAADQIMTGYDSTPYDTYNALQQQLEDIQNQIDNGTVTPGKPTTPPTTPPAPKPPPKTIPWIPSKPHPVPTTPKPPAKPSGKPSSPPPKNVVIKRGDTLSGIAKKAGISMATLKKLNPVFWTNDKYHDGNTIWAGGKVRVK
jgi:LysM repeat protein